ncbi:unnamed protein product [Strongylus vulgaris]|uniref:Uncharacterized protein n=1 Tax=Strongylus vulgaris TaxID=40348 RepID=A0A3P7JYE7_STRVU|nr:unnamed protein product [Strongylus vulgaris]
MLEEGDTGSGDLDQGSGMRRVTVLLGQLHFYEERTPAVDMEVLQRSGSNHRLLRTIMRFIRKLEKKICHCVGGGEKSYVTASD